MKRTYKSKSNNIARINGVSRMQPGGLGTEFFKTPYFVGEQVFYGYNADVETIRLGTVHYGLKDGSKQAHRERMYYSCPDDYYIKVSGKKITIF